LLNRNHPQSFQENTHPSHFSDLFRKANPYNPDPFEASHFRPHLHVCQEPFETILKSRRSHPPNLARFFHGPDWSMKNDHKMDWIFYAIILARFLRISIGEPEVPQRQGVCVYISTHTHLKDRMSPLVLELFRVMGKFPGRPYVAVIHMGIHGWFLAWPPCHDKRKWPTSSKNWKMGILHFRTGTWILRPESMSVTCNSLFFGLPLLQVRQFTYFE
jgi:hypothetical protein